MTWHHADQLVNPFLTPATLAMALWPSGPSKWICGDHLAFPSYKIAHHVRKGNGRLAISMPPRHGKSRLVSEAAIPWFLEEFHEKHVILISYNGDKAQEWGRKARDIIRNREDLFSVKVREDMARTDRFETDTGSEARFIGVTGHSGRGKNFITVSEDFTRLLLTAALRARLVADSRRLLLGALKRQCSTKPRPYARYPGISLRGRVRSVSHDQRRLVEHTASTAQASHSQRQLPLTRTSGQNRTAP